MNDQITLLPVCTVNGWQIKERTGKPVKAERLPRYSAWNGDRHMEDFRRLASAVRWCRETPLGDRPFPGLAGIADDLRDAHDGSGSRLPFRQWVQEMADNPRGTLRDAAKQFLDPDGERHRHKAAHSTAIGHGVVYEVCECGAFRRTEYGKGTWHACDLCVVRPGKGVADAG